MAELCDAVTFLDGGRNLGEVAHNIWYEKSFFKAESTPDTNRVVVQATNTPEAVGKVSYIHIETEPTNLRISLKVEGVSERSEAPGVLQIYMDGMDEGSLVNAQVQKQVRKESAYAQKFAADKAAADFQTWRKQLVQNMNDNYKWGGGLKTEVHSRIASKVSGGAGLAGFRFGKS